MRRPSRRSSGARRQRPRQRSSWVNATLAENSVVAGAISTSDLLSGLSQEEKVDVGTILTVHWQFTMGQGSSNAENHGRWGMMIVTQDAFIGGQIPEPLGDHQANWYWNEAYFLDEPDLRERQFRGQARTKRRLPSGEHTLAFAIESASGSSGTLKFGVGFRILYSHK